MPTLIGRFNELFHHLSSSSAAQQTTDPPSGRSSLAASGRPANHVQRHSSSVTSTDRPRIVRRSNSVSNSRVKSSSTSSTVPRNPPKSTSSSRGKHPSLTGETTSTSHRVRHRESSSTGPKQSQDSALSTKSTSRRESRRESSNPLAQQPSSRRQSSSSGSRRRHSIASITSTNSRSLQSATTGIVKSMPKSNVLSTRMSNKKSSKSIPVMHTTSTPTTGNNCPGQTRHSGSCTEQQQQANHTKPLTVIHTNNSDSGNSESDESLASKLARKMKISAITRKGSHCNPSNKPPSGKSIDFRKHFRLNNKKVSDTPATTEMDSSENGCFINRYLNGHLNKQHPDIISGKTCYDLPIKDIEQLSGNVVSSCTGPKGGLLSVNTLPPKPFDLSVDDVDFIDEDYPDSSLSSTGADNISPQPPKSCNVLSDSAETLTNSEGTGSPSSGFGSNLNREQIAGICDWNKATDYSYGISTSLYESHPTTKRSAGDPVADSFAVCVRENSAILALADGVNWGTKACLASRCAVFGCMEYLNNALYSPGECTRVKNTLDIFVALLRSFNAAHHLILTQGGHLTTLCAAVICQLKHSNRFIVCTCNVGDSLAYVYSAKHGVREITQESHDILSMRDMRDALGALGPVSGSEPELNNLTVAMTIVECGDIVFLTSDGISDNFDPVVGKFAIPKKEKHDNNVELKENGIIGNHENDSNDKVQQKKSSNKSRKQVQRSNSNPERTTTSQKYGLNAGNFTSRGLPLVSAKQRHELTLLRMEDLIKNGVNDFLSPSREFQRVTAKELCTLMVEFSTKLTMAKRHILEDPDLYSDDEDQIEDSEMFTKQRARRRLVGNKLVQMPGKLDHATIAAFEIGFYGSLAGKQKALMSTASNTNNNYLPATSNGLKTSPLQCQCAQSEEASFSSPTNPPHPDQQYNLKMKATLARFESQDSLDFCCEAGPI